MQKARPLGGRLRVPYCPRMLLLSRGQCHGEWSEERVVCEGPLRAVNVHFALLLRSRHQVPPRMDPEYWFRGHLTHSRVDPLGQGRPLPCDVQRNTAQIRRSVPDLLRQC